MRNQFTGYYRPSEEQFAQMWKECIFAFDANTLLNVYRYTAETRESFFNIIQRLKERIWLPYQAAYEYHENRLEVISEQLKLYDEIETELNQAVQRLKNLLAKYRRHPLIDIKQLTQAAEVAFQDIRSTLAEARSKHPDFLGSDELRERISQLFDGKVGQPYPYEELEKKHKEAELRLNRRIPPGYKDSEKADIKKYGDVIIWLQLLDYARLQNKPLLFITDNRKEDWWLLHKGRTIGPRPELVQEMRAKANVTFYMYQTDQFIGYAQKFLDLQDQQRAIEEVKEVRRQQEDQRVLNERIRRILERSRVIETPEFNERNRRIFEQSRMIETPELNERIRRILEQSRVIETPELNEIRRILEQSRVIETPELNEIRRILEEIRTREDSGPSRGAEKGSEHSGEQGENDESQDTGDEPLDSTAA